MAEPPAKRQKLGMSKTFIAVVGEGKKEFTLYTDIAKRCSKFFQTALSKDWQESLQNRVTLKDVTAIEFESYLQWLSTHDHSFLGELSMFTLAQLYILGDFLDDPAFRVDILKWFTSRAVTQNAYPSLDVIRLVWEQTPEHCPLRKMVVETWITSSIEQIAEQLAKASEEVPKAFVVDILRRISETKARTKECILGDERKVALETRRDEILKDSVA